MKHLTLLLSCLCILFLASCSKDDSTESTNSDPNSYIPLADGNEWVYSQSAGADIKFKVSSFGTKHWFNDNGAYKVKVGNWKTFKWDEIEQNKDTYTQYLTNFQTDIFSFGVLNGDSVAGYTLMDLTTSTKTEKVTVPAGTFDCLVFVDYSDPYTNPTYYVKKGVGIIKQTFSESGVITMSRELKSYTLH